MNIYQGKKGGIGTTFIDHESVMINKQNWQEKMVRKSIQKPELLGNIFLRWKYRCYVSLQAKVFKSHKIELAEDVFVYDGVFLNYNCYKNSSGISVKIGNNTRIMPNVFIQPIESHILIGKNCTIHPFSVLIGGTGGRGIEVGNAVRIATGCTIIASSHICGDIEVEIYKQGISSRGIKIGDDVLIGANVTILDGVRIGTGSIIGAGSVVSRSIPDYSVAYGIPAEVHRNRRRS